MKTETISGRTYVRTRPRGYAPWAPHAATRILLAQINTVLEEYAAHLPMTARQLFYRLVGSANYSKTELAYDRLCEALNRARRAGFIDMAAIRDDGTTADLAGGFDGVASFWEAVRYAADSYQHVLSAGQSRSVEVWVEAGGMVPMVSRIAHAYGADVYSSGGFDSVTAKHAAAMRIARRNRPTAVLHIGDYDPSGLSILDSVAEDIEAFVEAEGAEQPVFTRLAVTPEQIARYRLETVPQKSTDRRGEQMTDTVQAEALSPDELANEIRTGLEAVVDLNVLAAVRELAGAEREQILTALDELPGAADG